MDSAAKHSPPSEWSTARLLGRVHGRIRRLQGFVKGAHFEPDAHSPAVDAFLRKAGSKEIEVLGESLHQELRRRFGYKRKEMQYSCENGQTTIRTPEFEINLSIFQDPEEAKGYQIETEVSSFRDAALCLDPAFLHVFERKCHELLFPLSPALDIERKIDQLEETSLGEYLHYPADASWLSIKVPGSLVEMRLTSHELQFSLSPGGDLRQLIEGAQSLIAQLGMPTAPRKAHHRPEPNSLPG